MIYPILEKTIHKSELSNLKSEFRNQKSKTKIQKSQITIAISGNLKSTVEKSEIKNLISKMSLVTSSSDNHGLSHFAMSIDEY